MSRPGEGKDADNLFGRSTQPKPNRRIVNRNTAAAPPVPPVPPAKQKIKLVPRSAPPLKPVNADTPVGLQLEGKERTPSLLPQQKTSEVLTTAQTVATPVPGVREFQAPAEPDVTEMFEDTYVNSGGEGSIPVDPNEYVNSGGFSAYRAAGTVAAALTPVFVNGQRVQPAQPGLLDRVSNAASKAVPIIIVGKESVSAVSSAYPYIQSAASYVSSFFGSSDAALNAAMNVADFGELEIKGAEPPVSEPLQPVEAPPIAPPPKPVEEPPAAQPLEPVQVIPSGGPPEPPGPPDDKDGDPSGPKNKKNNKTTKKGKAAAVVAGAAGGVGIGTILTGAAVVGAVVYAWPWIEELLKALGGLGISAAIATAGDGEEPKKSKQK
jgi:hypothetical protein